MAPFTNQTILITGGASGIGLALAQRFLNANNTVIICGRRADKLLEAKMKFPQLHTRVCDVAVESERVALVEWATSAFPKLNVIVNNAGVQRRVKLSESKNWDQSEIAINLEAPMHLCMLFATHLSKQNESSIINVTSGLAFAPLAAIPIYCATKAAMHSFTLSLRHQFAALSNPIKVFEILPPAVNTDLGGVGLHTFGMPLDEFADAVFAKLRNGEIEIAHGFATEAKSATPEKLVQIFDRMNSR